MRKKGRELQRLTIEEVREFKGFERRTDEEIKLIIFAVEKIANLIFKKLKITNTPYD